jgi:hypothetical protein
MVALLAFITSRDVAIVAGPYAAIVILACAGAALSLSGAEERMSPFAGAWFIFVRVFIAVAITVALAEGMQWFFPKLAPRYTLAPIAFAIGWIKDYNSVRAWLGGLIDRFASKKVSDGQ